MSPTRSTSAHAARALASPRPLGSASSPEAHFVAIASRQHGVVEREQLLEAGLTPDRVDGWVRAGRPLALHRGVYLHGARAGPLEPARAREMAAVLAGGVGAAVSHESAARIWELLRPSGKRTPIQVTVSGGDRGRRPGIRAHRVVSLATADWTTMDGVAVTVPPRTLVDVAARLTPRTLEQAVAEVEVDFFWPAERVVVEVDGFAYHASRGTFERDRHRDARLAATGVRVVRVTWRQIEDEPHAVLARLAQVLALARARV